jgi:hypothetical protein
MKHVLWSFLAASLLCSSLVNASDRETARQDEGPVPDICKIDPAACPSDTPS